MRGIRLHLSCLMLSMIACSAAIAQFAESEPYDSNAQATLIACPADGATIAGSAALIGGAPPGPGSIDYYLIRTCTAPDGIYRNRLYVRTRSGTPAHAVQLVGLPDPAAPTESVVASSTHGSASVNFVQWYTFGPSHEIYARVYADIAAGADYELRYERTSITALSVTRFWTPAPFTFSSGAGPDGRAIAVFNGQNSLLEQHEAPAFDTVSFSRELSVGVYYIAESLPHLVTSAPNADAIYPHLDAAGAVVGTRPIPSQDNSCCDPFPAEPFLVRWSRVQVVDTPRPCCFSDGACSIIPAADCITAAGRYQPVDSSCAGGCPAPRACCLPDGSCTLAAPGFCTGYSLGVGTTCAAAPCPAPRACCIACGCVLTSPLICSRDGGTPLDAGVGCANSVCAERACCFPDSGCACLTPQQCTLRGGLSQAADATCALVACPVRCLGGDANCDNAVNNFDVDPWIIGVLNAGAPSVPNSYLATGATAACWELRNCWGDVNGDRGWNGFDVDPFVTCIIVQPPPGSPCN